MKFKSQYREDRKFERFMSTLSIDKNNCWIRRSSKHSGGYTTTSGDFDELLNKYKQIFAHRYIYEIFKGPIAEGLEIDHLCRVRNCCNPDHLEAVTKAENIRRGSWRSGYENWAASNRPKIMEIINKAVEARVKSQKSKQSCPKGHPYTKENTILGKDRNGEYRDRRCKECNRIWRWSRAKKMRSQVEAIKS